MSRITVGIAGASGYGGGELLRLLLRHPNVEVAAAVSQTYAGKGVAAAFPGLTGQSGLVFSASEGADQFAKCDIVFLAQDNRKAMVIAPQLVAAGSKVVDLSADFRFRDPAVYAAWYAGPHANPHATETAVYGLPEVHGNAIRRAAIVGNPGCYATATILALAPLAAGGLVDMGTVIVDAKSGVSGAGRAKFSLDYHFPEINESVSAYKVAGTHRHTPEIEQMLAELTGNPCVISFTPHLIPITRGILATCYANLIKPLEASALRRVFTEFYRDAPFVSVLDDRLPATKHTLGSNRCHIGLAVDARTNRVTVVSAIDNLIKGAAGQAVQNMNLMCGLDETTGLSDIGGLWP